MDVAFSTTKVLRGPKNFEDWYQGKTINYPLVLVDQSQTPDGLDPISTQAWGKLSNEARENGGVPPPGGYANNTTGFDPYLCAGVPVPLGARCLLWLPFYGPDQQTLGSEFQYSLIWRLRSASTYRQLRKPFHLVSDRGYDSGDPALYANNARLRRLVPSCRETIAFQQAEPGVGSATNYYGDAKQNLWPVAIKTHTEWGADLNGTTRLRGPLIRNFESPTDYSTAVEGYYEQGILDQGTPDSHTTTFVCYETRCKGDELVIAVMPTPGEGVDPEVATYNFNAASDQWFMSYLFGRSGYTSSPTTIPFNTKNSALGVYISTGVG